MRLGALAAALLLPAALSACAVATGLNSLLPGSGAEAVDRGIAYGPLREHRLDVYHPAPSATLRPALIFFYGGGWVAGSKSTYAFAGQAFAEEGLVTIMPDYRFSRFPDFLDDGARAIAWVRANAATLGVDPNRIVLAGHSSGAYIAAMLAMDQARLAAAGVPPEAIAGWAGLAGMYLFDPREGGPIRATFGHVADPAEMQPLRLIDPADPPAFLATGGRDGMVDTDHTAQLAAALHAGGVRVEERTYRGTGHIGMAASLAGGLGRESDVLLDVAGFLLRLPARTAGR
ncbi:MAG: alpha/beta hydrolase [Pseudolabrys sp.]|nr:alpha/beta hydrolase [Pseudolabrys sp.]MCW5697659.1 alpha/beta hydrolase [Bauldia sp.]